MTNLLAPYDILLAGTSVIAPLELVGRSAAVRRVAELLDRAALSETAVFLVAEKGTDLVAVARELHRRRIVSKCGSDSARAPFVEVDSAGSSLERDLFGTSSGTSGGDLEAISPDSRLAAAHGGTLFLHDVTELPSGAQARLARILRDREVWMRGERVATAFSLIAGAAPSVDEEVHARRFRADLYRRVSTTRIDLPPLRERASDVPAMASRILQEIADTDGRRRTFTQAALALLGAMPWPGNLAELREAIARISRGSGDEVLQIEHVLPALQLDRPPAPFVPVGSLRDARLRFERDYIAAVLQHHGWRMADAAQTLGIQRPNLYRKARQLGIPIAGTDNHEL